MRTKLKITTFSDKVLLKLLKLTICKGKLKELQLHDINDYYNAAENVLKRLLQFISAKFRRLI